MSGLIVLALITAWMGVAAAARGGPETSPVGVVATQPTPGLNQPVRDGKFEFVVKSVTCGIPSVGNETLGKQAQGQFCEVALTVKNIGNESQLFDGSAQKAIGQDGKKYSNDSEAELFANPNNETFLNEINPGNTASGTLVFDIPTTAKIKQVELHDSPFSHGATVNVS